MPENYKKVLKSYVYTDKGNFFVSTVFRQDSTPYATWFYETLVWKLNDENEREEHILYMSEGLENHYEICRQLIRTGEYNEANN